MSGGMIPHRTPFFIPIIYPSLVWRIPTADLNVYLTFDDGPIPGPTEFVLDELKKTSTKATFFCIGDNIRKHPGIFDRVVSEGHAIGNHTFNHLSGWSTSTPDYLKNINQFESQLPTQMKPPRVFRPPYGRITPSQIKALKHYEIIMWDVLSFDYSKNISPDDCLNNTIKAIRPGSIIVFHDSLKAERNMRFALPRLIHHLLGKGYSFKTLPE
jgi:peptidoglycan-N-acetylglucosamine deacetylase